LFQDRYKSEAVETDPYFVVVLRYIHQNPKKAGLCKSLDKYEWSSYNEYIRRRGIVDYAFALEIIGESSFESFMNEKRDDMCLELAEPGDYLSDEELASMLEELFKIKAIKIQNEPKENRDIILTAAMRIQGVSMRQLSRVTGVSINMIWRVSNR